MDYTAGLVGQRGLSPPASGELLCEAKPTVGLRGVPEWAERYHYRRPIPSKLDDDNYFRPASFAGIATVGTMMCAYFVPFHITHGPPLCGSVGKASN